MNGNLIDLAYTVAAIVAGVAIALSPKLRDKLGKGNLNTNGTNYLAQMLAKLANERAALIKQNGKLRARLMYVIQDNRVLIKALEQCIYNCERKGK